MVKTTPNVNTPVNESIDYNPKSPTSKVQKSRKKKHVATYSSYIYRILKQVHSDTGISSKAMSVMNSFITDISERIIEECADLVRWHGKKTLSSSDIETTVNLMLPGDIASYAVNEGTKAVSKYISSNSK